MQGEWSWIQPEKALPRVCFLKKAFLKSNYCTAQRRCLWQQVPVVLFFLCGNRFFC